LLGEENGEFFATRRYEWYGFGHEPNYYPARTPQRLGRDTRGVQAGEAVIAEAARYAPPVGGGRLRAELDAFVDQSVDG